MFSIEEKNLSAYTGSAAEHICLPQGVETIDSRVFLGHSELKSAVFSDTVKTVGDAAFCGCTNLEEVRFGSSIKRLKADCFRGCTSLKRIVMPQSIASIRAGAFSGCTSLEELVLSAGLRRSIESDTFADCRSLKQIVFPAQVELIEYKAFCDCTMLETVVFENPDIRIERGAFVGCVSLDEETARFIKARTFSRVVLDIRNATPSPVGRLSNLTARQFVFDGVQCGSIEGVLQSFKCPDIETQRMICRLSGNEARTAGMPYDWKSRQELYWLGTVYPRSSEAYQQLLDCLYDAVYRQDASFREDLYQVRSRELSHRLGRPDPAHTILTRQELINRLERMSLRCKATN